MRTAILIAMLAMSTPASAAYDFQCNKFRPMLQDRSLERPKPPFCATTYGEFADWEFNNCKAEMTSFEAKVREFIDCLVKENGIVVDEYNQTVQSFNRRAGG